MVNPALLIGQHIPFVFTELGLAYSQGRKLGFASGSDFVLTGRPKPFTNHSPDMSLCDSLIAICTSTRTMACSHAGHVLYCRSCRTINS